jgi:hypothetical protein
MPFGVSLKECFSNFLRDFFFFADLVGRSNGWLNAVAHMIRLRPVELESSVLSLASMLRQVGEERKDKSFALVGLGGKHKSFSQLKVRSQNSYLFGSRARSELSRAPMVSQTVCAQYWPPYGTMGVACCCVLLRVACWVLGVGCWVLGVGCWVLGVGCWVLGVGCWVLGVGCCVLHVVACCCVLLCVVCWVLGVACCVLRVACCVLRVACCVLRVACWVLGVGCCVLLRVVACCCVLLRVA